MQVKTIGFTAVMLISVAIIGFKASPSATGQTASHSATPRVLLVAELSEADMTGDACAEMIHLVRAARERGIVVQELGAGSKSDLLARYYVRIIPTVLILDVKGKEVVRFEGEGRDVLNKLRTALAQLK